MNLVDVETGEKIFLGGVNSGSGVQRQLIGAKRRWQRLRPDLTIHCFEGALDGEGPITVSGAAALVPPRFGGGGDGGSGGSGGGTGQGSGDPTAPARGSGCSTVVFGTNSRDELIRCGSGRDRALIDRLDRTRGCERVKLKRS